MAYGQAATCIRGQPGRDLGAERERGFGMLDGHGLVRKLTKTPYGLDANPELHRVRSIWSPVTVGASARLRLNHKQSRPVLNMEPEGTSPLRDRTYGLVLILAGR